MKAVILSDNPASSDELKNAAGRYFNANKKKATLRIFSDPKTFFKYMETFPGDCSVLILDMSGENRAIEIARRVNSEYPSVMIIFIASPSTDASDISGAFVYLLTKPVDELSFARAIESVESARLTTAREETDTVSLGEKDSVYKINTNQIVYMESLERKIYIHLENKPEIEIKGKLSDMEQLLAPRENFIRVHQSYIVNMDKISRISGSNIQLITKEIINIPRKRLSEVTRAFYAYTGSKS